MFEDDKLNTPIQDFLDEVATTSTVRITKKAKISQQAGAVAIRMAKEKNDSEYRLYKKYRDLYMKSKKKIMAKYERKAYREVMMGMSGSKTTKKKII